jgi:hypothetical protein
MTCPSEQGRATLRHDILQGISRHAITRAGVASTLEPTLRRLPRLDTGARDGAVGLATADLQARGDILLALDTDMAVAEVSVTHTGGVAVQAAAVANDGTAAKRRKGEKRQWYGRLEPNGYSTPSRWRAMGASARTRSTCWDALARKPRRLGEG